MTDPLSLFQRIRISIFPGTLRSPKEREGYRRFFNSLILHFRPRTVPERTLRFTLTWGFGGTAVVLVLMLIGTGFLLKFVCQPSTDKAYESILRLHNEVLFGQLIRNLHHWSANLLIIVAFLHFLRVYFTGAFQSPRQFNWVIGLGLFFTVLLSNFTGYLLPWDNLAFWAITISMGVLEYIPVGGIWLQRLIQGGPEVGPATLSIFYAIHTAILPAAFIILMPFLMAIALLSLPYFNYQSDTSGVWFGSFKGRRMALVAVLAALVARHLSRCWPMSTLKSLRRYPVCPFL